MLARATEVPTGPQVRRRTPRVALLVTAGLCLAACASARPLAPVVERVAEGETPVPPELVSWTAQAFLVGADADGFDVEIRLAGEWRTGFRQFGEFRVEREEVPKWRDSQEFFDLFSAPLVPFYLWDGEYEKVLGVLSPAHNVSTRYEKRELSRERLSTEREDVIKGAPIGGDALLVACRGRTCGCASLDSNGRVRLSLPYEALGAKGWRKAARGEADLRVVDEDRPIAFFVALPPAFSRAVLFARHGEGDIERVAEDIEDVRMAARVLDACGKLSTVVTVTRHCAKLADDLRDAYRAARVGKSILRSRWLRGARVALKSNLISLVADLVIGELIVYAAEEYFESLEKELQEEARRIAEKDLLDASRKPVRLDVQPIEIR